MNTTRAKGRINEADKGLHDLKPLGGNQQVNIVNESGLCDAILDSRKSQARAFRRWTTSDVIPSIRRHGVYVTEAVAKEGPDVLMSIPGLGIRDVSPLNGYRISDLHA